MRRLLIALILFFPVVCHGQILQGMAAAKASGGTTAAPAYGGEIKRAVVTDSTATTVITIPAGGVAQGTTIVVAVLWQSTAQTLTSIADNKNAGTYAIHQNVYTNPQHLALASHYVGTALAQNDTITITWANEAYTYRMYGVFYINNAASSGQPNQTAYNTTYSASPTAAASTTAANTACIGVIEFPDTSKTYTSAWNVIGAGQSAGGNKMYFVQKDFTSAGSQNPAGTISAADTYMLEWVAFK